ncbi:3-keto-disaccharide hydrolase [Labilibacter marinus]|uniref:3-keto-disaccharide hydrolase n=1 Tax=Labilibacter marinus TaxID=1477105 RepID=UPI00082EC723|nr:DUF1080 domain-containing protein [Labilibacter marinus]
MKKILTSILLLSTVIISAQKEENNTLTKKEIKKGWELLFDGKTSDGWKGISLDHFPTHGWVIKNGELKVNATDGAESKNGGDIVTHKAYGPDFILVWDWKMETVGGNSGLKYFVQENRTQKGKKYGYGLEYQVLDDMNHTWMKNGKMEPNDYHTLGSLYEFFPASPKKSPAPLGEWNTSKIVSKNNKVEHWLNGKKILTYERGGEEFLEMLGKSKFKKIKNFGQEDTGKFLLQDHGGKVSYRNIKIRKL